MTSTNIVNERRIETPIADHQSANPNITLKNLNLIFNKPENLNFSSILMTSEKDSMISGGGTAPHLNEDHNRTPDAHVNCSNYPNTDPYHSHKNKLIFSNVASKKFDEKINTPLTMNIQQNPNKYQIYLNKIKYDEFNIKDVLSYASSLFDLKEYVKCSYVLKLYAIPKYPTAAFLYYYSEYMIIQQKAQEEFMENSDLGSKYCSSTELSKLLQTLNTFFDESVSLVSNQNSIPCSIEPSPFILYLYAIICKEMKIINQAKSALIKSLNIFPFLWPAWVELALLSKQNEMVRELILYTSNNLNIFTIYFLENNLYRFRRSLDEILLFSKLFYGT
jgi:hypothetical protein